MKYCKHSKKIKVDVKLKDRKLLKSSKVRAYIKEVEKILNKHLEEQSAFDKIIDAYALGVPIKITNKGEIIVVKNFYKKPKNNPWSEYVTNRKTNKRKS